MRVQKPFKKSYTALTTAIDRQPIKLKDTHKITIMTVSTFILKLLLWKVLDQINLSEPSS